MLMKEMQIKTSMRYHYVPVIIMVRFKKTDHIKSLQGWRETTVFIMLMGETVNSMNIWKTVWQFSKTLDVYHMIQLFHSQVFIPEEQKHMLIQRPVHEYTWKLYLNSPKLETIQIFIYLWMEKQIVLYPYYEIPSSKKKNKIVI